MEKAIRQAQLSPQYRSSVPRANQPPNGVVLHSAFAANL
jgi:hypothetical protein